MMKIPVAVLSGATLVLFIVAIATAHAAKEKLRFTFLNGSYGQDAASLAAVSNVSLTLAGVGCIALLVVWAIVAGLRERPVKVTGTFPAGTVWSSE